MKLYSKPVQDLIEQFAKLPGIGYKTATRLAFYVLNMPKESSGKFANCIKNATEKTFTCSICQNLTDSEICDICSSTSRDNSIICVVAEPKDLMAFEKTREFFGLYHVLHGNISPLNNIGPDDIRIKELISRVDDNIKEVIICTNPDTEGEATAMYISRILRPFEIKVTRLAYGIPVGSSLEFIDELTLARAMEGRVII